MLLGSMMLMNTGLPYVTIPWTTILAAVGSTSLFFVLVVGKAMAALRRGATMGREALIGALGNARTDLNPEGTVFLEGERWTAVTGDGPIPQGSRVRVIALDGIKLVVQKA
jgi:membrane-bound serine protease (ClpP class)